MVVVNTNKFFFETAICTWNTRDQSRNLLQQIYFSKATSTILLQQIYFSKATSAILLQHIYFSKAILAIYFSKSTSATTCTSFRASSRLNDDNDQLHQLHQGDYITTGIIDYDYNTSLTATSTPASRATPRLRFILQSDRPRHYRSDCGGMLEYITYMLDLVV